MKILLTGGGSGGPVSPVLAVAEALKKLKPKTEFLFVGTNHGPERQMVEQGGIQFEAIVAAKWRRYFSLKNLASPFLFIIGLVQSVLILRRFRPDAMFTAGGFVGVPVAWAAKLMRVKIIIHQQDARIGLANKLVSPLADKITTAFEATAKMFYSGSGLLDQKLEPRAEWVGNPFRAGLLNSKVNAAQYFNLHHELPILLVLTGATGALQINQLIEKSLPELVRSYQVVHQTGQGKNTIKFTDANYHPFELIEFQPYAAILKAALIVVCRAGLSTITELSALGKPAIVIPMPGTHQEDNAAILVYTSSAAVISGKHATAGNLLKFLNHLKFTPSAIQTLSENISLLMPHDAAERIAKIIIRTCP